MTRVTCPTVLLALLTDLMEQNPLSPRPADAGNARDLLAVFESLRRQLAPTPDAVEGQSASQPHQVAPGTLSTGLAVLIALELLKDRLQPATFTTIDSVRDRLQLVVEDARGGLLDVAVVISRRDRASVRHVAMTAELRDEMNAWRALVAR